MQIALVSPHGGGQCRSHPLIGREPGGRENPFRLERLYSMPSLSLLTLDAILTAQGLSCRCFDGVREALPDLDTLSGFDAVLFSGMSWQADEARRLAGQLTRRGIITVGGGVHWSFQSGNHPFHTLFSGELEEGAAEFVRDLQAGRLQPEYRPPTPGGELRSPIPAYHQLPTDSLIPLQLSRGCPCDCNFCIGTRAFGPLLRTRPLRDVEALLAEILAAHPRPALFIADDNLFRARDYALQVLARLAGSGVRFLTHGELSLARDPQLLAALARAGCVSLLVGIESPDADSIVAEAPYKGRLAKDARTAVRRIQDAGIGVTGSFIVGFDADDVGVFERIRRFAEETALYEICVKVLTPFPGTALRERLAGEGRLLDRPFAEYDARHLVFQARGLDRDEMDQGLADLAAAFVAPEAMKQRIRVLKNRHAAGGKRHGRSLRVVLISPAEPARRLPSSLGAGFRAALAGLPGRNIHRCPPLALYQLAAWLREDDDWQVVDEAAGDRLEDALPADLLLVSALTCQTQRALSLAETARAAGIPCVVGGPHATSMPECFADHFDAVVRGEAEEIIGELLEDFRRGQGKAEYIAPGPADLSRTRPARYDRIPQDRYSFLPLQISRGCPRACRYCASSTLHGSSLRVRPEAVIAAEIAAIARDHPRSQVYIVDDNFALLNETAEQRKLLSRAGLAWSAYGDPSLIERSDWLDQAAAQGCRRLLVGFETPASPALAAYAPGKQAYAERYAGLVEAIQSRGILCFGGFIAGLPGDGAELFSRIAAFLEETLLAEFCLSFLTPFPGTPFFREMEAAGRILSREWRLYDGFHPILAMDGLGPDEAIAAAETVLARYLDPALTARRTAYFKAVLQKRISHAPHALISEDFR